MITAIESTIWRFKKARSIDQVLKRFIAPRQVRKIQKEVGNSTLLLDELSKRQNLSQKALYSKVAELLKVDSSQKLSCPSSATLAEFGLSISELKIKKCVPQDSDSSRPVIAASDLTITKSDYFISGNYQLKLAPVDEIEKILNHLCNSQSSQSSELSLEQIQSVITQLAIDADTLGAAEVLIGVPSVDHYEFIVGEQHYSGKLHPGVCEKLLIWLTGKRKVRIKTGLSNFEVLKLSIPNEGRDRIVFLSWGTAEKTKVKENKVEKKALSSELTIGQPQANNATKLVNKVLLVEDDARYAKLLSGLLNKNGFSVTHFTDAESALDFFSKDSLPDLIISDIHLPTLNGDEFTKKIRAQSDSVPVLVLTSDDRTLLEAELVDIGANAFLRKDEDIRVILSWCKSLSKSKNTVQA